MTLFELKPTEKFKLKGGEDIYIFKEIVRKRVPRFGVVAIAVTNKESDNSVAKFMRDWEIERI